MGLLVHPCLEFKKVGYLLQGISPGILGQDNKALEDTWARWTDLFCAGNKVLFTELRHMLGGLDIW